MCRWEGTSCKSEKKIYIYIYIYKKLMLSNIFMTRLPDFTKNNAIRMSEFVFSL